MEVVKLIKSSIFVFVRGCLEAADPVPLLEVAEVVKEGSDPGPSNGLSPLPCKLPPDHFFGFLPSFPQPSGEY